jgi:hypothetical protein
VCKQVVAMTARCVAVGRELRRLCRARRRAAGRGTGPG